MVPSPILPPPSTDTSVPVPATFLTLALFAPCSASPRDWARLLATLPCELRRILQVLTTSFAPPPSAHLSLREVDVLVVLVALFVPYCSWNRPDFGGGALEIFGQAATTNSPGMILLGLLVLLVGLLHQSETFERLVGSKIRGPFYLAYGTYALPAILLLLELQRRSPRRTGGGLRILFVLVLVFILVILGVLGLIAFLIYRYLRRRR